MCQENRRADAGDRAHAGENFDNRSRIIAGPVDGQAAVHGSPGLAVDDGPRRPPAADAITGVPDADPARSGRTSPSGTDQAEPRAAQHPARSAHLSPEGHVLPRFSRSTMNSVLDVRGEWRSPRPGDEVGRARHLASAAMARSGPFSAAAGPRTAVALRARRAALVRPGWLVDRERPEQPRVDARGTMTRLGSRRSWRRRPGPAAEIAITRSDSVASSASPPRADDSGGSPSLR